MAGIPPLNSEVLSTVEKLAAKPEVRAAFAEAERDVDRAMREQIELLLFTKKTVPSVWLN